MKTDTLSRRDVDRAMSLVNDLLESTRTPVEVRRRVERIVTRCESQSHRWAFWRLILALIVAASNTGVCLADEQWALVH